MYMRLRLPSVFCHILYPNRAILTQCYLGPRSNYSSDKECFHMLEKRQQFSRLAITNKNIPNPLYWILETLRPSAKTIEIPAF